MTTADLIRITAACKGDCGSCPVSADCQDFRDFMDAAAQDFENQSIIVLEDMFNDPAECERVRKEVFG